MTLSEQVGALPSKRCRKNMKVLVFADPAAAVVRCGGGTVVALTMAILPLRLDAQLPEAEIV